MKVNLFLKLDENCKVTDDLNRSGTKVYTNLNRKRVTNLEDAIHDLKSESRPFSNHHQHIFQIEAWDSSIPMKRDSLSK